MSQKAQSVNRALFSVILKEGRTYHSPHLSLRVHRIKPTEEGVFAFVVSKKVTKSAVRRNLLKRRGRHILRASADTIQRSFAGIVFFKKGAEKLSFYELQEEILLLLRKAGVLLE